MTFDEAIDAVSAQPDLCLTGIALDRKGEWMTIYFLASEDQTPELFCERTQLFSGRQENCEFDMKEAPAEAMLIDYSDHAEVMGRMGVNEHALRALLPDLPDPNVTKHAEFKSLAVQAAQASEFITIVESHPGEAV